MTIFALVCPVPGPNRDCEQEAFDVPGKFVCVGEIVNLSRGTASP